MGRVTEAMRRAGAIEDDPAGDALSVAEQELFPAEGSGDVASEIGQETSLAAAVMPISAKLSPDAASVLDRLSPKVREKVVVDPLMMAACREQYRRLAATLHHMQVESDLKVVMIASAAAGEGKSLTASNLALTLSESYRRRVLLIDADLRRPTLHTIFDLGGGPGLSEVLGSVEPITLPLRPISSALTVLPAGRPTGDPMAGLTSARMRQLITDARAKFDWVIVDTPPIGLLPDSSLLGAMVDGALLVVRADLTPYDLVQRSVEALGKERVLGVVLNSTTARSAGRGYYRYYNHYYGTKNPAATK